jgi:O-antigen chain-terminating methyltransferase
VTSDFYRAFEDRYRGSRELIKSRLQVYVPFLQPLLAHYPGGQAIDLGCGRGEWLELVTELGLSATGVDLDDGMLAACRERGLNVTTGDGLALLKSLPDCSQVVVSGFHFAEHIPFDSLLALVKEALRVLQPGGLLILETPNPENIAVGTCHFYLDPSHQRPIPPQLLSFLTEYEGFARTKIVRLQESAELSGDVAVALADVFAGVSPDYAVVAQKNAEPHVLAATNPAFQREYGLGLETLAQRYDKQQRAVGQVALAKAHESEARINLTEARLAQAEMKAVETETRAAQAEIKAVHAEAKAGHAEARAGQAETRAGQAEIRASQAEDRATHAEELQAAGQIALAKAREAEARINRAEARLAQTEMRAGDAETRAAQAEIKAEQAEARAGHAETRAGQAEIRASQAENRATHAEIKASQAEARAAHAEAEANMHQAEIRAAQAESIAREAATRAAEAEARAHQAAALAHDTAAQLGNVLASTSWRVTKPLRWMRARIIRPVQALTRVVRIFSHRNK